MITSGICSSTLQKKRWFSDFSEGMILQVFHGNPKEAANNSNNYGLWFL